MKCKKMTGGNGCSFYGEWLGGQTTIVTYQGETKESFTTVSGNLALTVTGARAGTLNHGFIL